MWKAVYPPESMYPRTQVGGEDHGPRGQAARGTGSALCLAWPTRGQAACKAAGGWQNDLLDGGKARKSWVLRGGKSKGKDKGKGKGR